MIKPQQLAPLFFALMLAATSLRAQPEAEGTAANGSTTEPTTTQQAPASSEPASTSASASTSNSSPFDYRSSEKISEDVPVSFPVDI